MTSTTLPNDPINFNSAQRQLLVDQINSLEFKVREIERKLLEQATSLHDAVVEKLDSLFDEHTLVEFQAFPGEEGTIKISSEGSANAAIGRSKEVFDTIKATRDQLELLNQTIQKIQLAR
ncbi:MAG: hypothetical protein P1U89_08980 [Verrucomicrobiales bacterium]|nr:hypothetical protein [Verrucomicrobiales bacterium]